MIFLFKIILKLINWKYTGEVQKDFKKYIIIVAPHTSNYDFIIGRLIFSVLKLKGKFLIKKELFFFPLGIILKAFGGFPVNRENPNKAVIDIVNHFNSTDEFVLVVTPEGTRKRTKKWKKGFYFMALNAKVPIMIAFLDYKNKIGGIEAVFYPTGDYEKDIIEIQKYYKKYTAKYPENFYLE